MYIADEKRYDGMKFNRCGKSGLRLPAVSLGLWQNFGYKDDFETMEEMCRTAFDLGITHFDIANNYGHPHNGAAEENFCRILQRGLGEYRDQLIISTKAGYEMWDGPYGDRNGSRKYLTASLDQSLKRLGLDYVDIYYHHIFDPDTPLEETALALDNAVRQGKALYVGISNYNSAQTAEIMSIFKELKTPFVVNQPSYSMLNRWIEDDGLDRLAEDSGFGLAVFSPLYQGLLTDRYLKGIPDGSRIAKGRTWIGSKLNDELVVKLNKLNDIAAARGQSLAQMALAWVLHNPAVTTVIIGASRPQQIIDNVAAANSTDFTDEEINKIEEILRD
ncbi:MAG: aldo/keto reductase [Eubacterium sp.]|nr:aldo/keto reductase [Eubacterium sp.]